MKKFLHYLGILVALGVFAAAVWVLQHTLRDLSWDELMRQFAQIPLTHIALSLLFTALAYLILTIYDTTAFAYIGRHVSYVRVAFVSFLSYAFSHSLGFGGVTGGAVRYRFYTAWGVRAIDVAKVVVFGGAAYFLGAFAVAGVLVLVRVEEFRLVTGLPAWVVMLFGLACVLAGCVYVAWSALGRPSIPLGGMLLAPPKLWIPGAQLGVACLEWSFASAALYWLLPAEVGIDYWHFIGIFVIAYLSGMISHVPGGLGVFETVVLLLLPKGVPPEAVIAAIITYRAVYFVLPLLIASAMVAVYEIRQGHVHLSNILRRRKDDDTT
ncbi:MAG: lysylphosphatidylglycerol synthase domain-containing protein [Alphaproteobacteria bacterium]